MNRASALLRPAFSVAGMFARVSRRQAVVALSLAGSLALGQDQTVSGNLTVTGNATVSGTTDSTTKDTGAVVIEGGVGVEKNINVGGSITATTIIASGGTITSTSSPTNHGWRITSSTSDWWIGENIFGNGTHKFTIGDIASGTPHSRFVIDSSGNVGIGTTEPAAKLDIAGDVRVSGALTLLGGSNIPLVTGGSSGLRLALADTAHHISLEGETRVKFAYSNTKRFSISNFDHEVAIVGVVDGDGYRSRLSLMGSLTNSNWNLAADVPEHTKSLFLNRPTDGAIVFKEGGYTTQMVLAAGGNVGIGTTTPGAKLDVDGSVNVSAGSGYQINGSTVLRVVGSGLFVGPGAGNTSSTGTANAGVGSGALSANTSGSGNAGLGVDALKANTTGTNNSGFGNNSLLSNTTGVNNLAIGSNALYYNTTGSQNVALGQGALLSNVTGHGSSAIGRQAGYGATGSNNFFLGFRAGYAASSGSYNIAIGHQVDLPIPSGSNQLTIGNLIFGTGVDGTGTTVSSGNIGIGIANPSVRLQVAGDEIVSGNVTVGGGLTVAGTLAAPSFSASALMSPTALNLASGGTNQDITLDPSGTGVVRVALPGGQDLQLTEANSSTALVSSSANLKLAAGTSGAITIAANGGGNQATFAASGAIDLTAQGSDQNITLTPSGSGVTTTGKRLTVTDATASTSPSTGALVVSGGVGIGGNLNVGGTLAAGNITIAGSSFVPSNYLALSGGILTGNVKLAAGTTTTAPLTLQSGTNLTTPVFGAVEFDGTNVFVTNNSSSPTRKTVAYAATTLSGYGITDPVVLTSGTYANPAWVTSLAASKLTGLLSATALPAFSGDVTSSAGSATLTLANSGVTAGTYAKVTVDAKGRVTSGALLTGTDVTDALGFQPYNGTTNPAGYITSAGVPVQSVFGRTGAVVLTSSDVTTALGGALGVNSGNVGIGTTTPRGRLDVIGNIIQSGGTQFQITNSVSSTGFQIVGNDGSANIIGTMGANEPLAIRTGSTERMRVDASGNVGIGTASPQHKLQVYGTLKVGGSSGQASGVVALGDDQSTSTNVGIFRGLSTGSAGDGNVLLLGGYAGVGITTGNQALGAQGAPDVFVDTAGNVGIGTTSPGAKLDVAGSVNFTGNVAVGGNLAVAGAFSAPSYAASTGAFSAAAGQNFTATAGTGGASITLGQGANGSVTLTPSGSGRVTSAGSYSTTKLSSAASASQTWANYSLQLIAAQTTGQHASSIGWAENDGQNVSSAITGVDWGGGGAHGLAIWTGNITTLSRALDVTPTGNLLIGGTSDIAGSGGLKVFGSTSSTSPTSGALQVAGGAGIAGAVNIGGNLTLTDITLARTPLNLTVSTANAADNVSLNLLSGTNQAIFTLGRSAQKFSIFTDPTNLTIRDTTANYYLMEFPAGLSSTTGYVKINPTTPSVSSTSGALVVGGGAGIAGNVNVGGSLSVTGAFSAPAYTASTGAFNAAAGQNFTATAGSGGASLALGQGTNGGATFNAQGTGTFTFTQSGHASQGDIAFNSGGAIGVALDLKRTTSTANGTLAQLNAYNGATRAGIIDFTSGGATDAGNIDFYTKAPGVGISLLARMSGGGNLLIGGTSDISGNGGLKVFGSTVSSGPTTGALIVAGGVGVGGAVNVGGDLTVKGGNLTVGNGSQTYVLGGTYDPSLILAGGDAQAYYLAYNSTGNQPVWIGKPGTTQYTRIRSTALASSTTTGALVVDGGVGVAGSIYGNTVATGDGANGTPALRFASLATGFYKHGNGLGININGINAGYIDAVTGSGGLWLESFGAGSNSDITLKPKGAGVVNITTTLSVAGTSTSNFASDVQLAPGKIVYANTFAPSAGTTLTLGTGAGQTANVTGVLTVSGTGTSSFGGAVTVANGATVNGGPLVANAGLSSASVTGSAGLALIAGGTGNQNISFTPTGSGQVFVKNSANQDSLFLAPSLTAAAIGSSVYGGSIALQTRTIGGVLNPHQVFLSANGNVGVGTSAPTVPLEVAGDTLITAGANSFRATLDSAGNTTKAVVNRNGNVGEFGVYSGASFNDLVSGTAFLSSGGSATQLSLNTTGATPITFTTDNWTERMRISPGTGFVGIGTANPGDKLELNGGWDQVALALTVGGASGRDYGARWRTRDTGSGVYTSLDTKWAGAWTDDRLTILSSNGNVGLGTTTPGAKLDVVGDAIVSGQLTAASLQLGDTLFNPSSLISTAGGTMTGSLTAGGFTSANITGNGGSATDRTGLTLFSGGSGTENRDIVLDPFGDGDVVITPGNKLKMNGAMQRLGEINIGPSGNITQPTALLDFGNTTAGGSLQGALNSATTPTAATWSFGYRGETAGSFLPGLTLLSTSTGTATLTVNGTVQGSTGLEIRAAPAGAAGDSSVTLAPGGAGQVVINNGNLQLANSTALSFLGNVTPGAIPVLAIDSADKLTVGNSAAAGVLVTSKAGSDITLAPGNSVKIASASTALALSASGNITAASAITMGVGSATIMSLSPDNIVLTQPSKVSNPADVSISGTLPNTAALLIEGGLGVKKGAAFGGAVQVLGNGSLVVTGTTTLGNTTVAGPLVASQGATISGGTLTAGVTNLGNTTISGPFSATQGATISGTLNANGGLNTGAANAIVGGNLSVGNVGAVTGSATSGITVGGVADFHNGLTFSSVTIVSGNVTVTPAGSLTWGTTSSTPLSLVAGANQGLTLAAGNSADLGLKIQASGNVVASGSLSVGMGNVSVASALTLGGSSPALITDTDAKAVVIGGGSVASAANGATITLSGKDRSTNPGDMLIAAGNVTGGEIRLGTGGVEDRVIVTDAGNVGIGTGATTGAKLDVVGDGRFTTSLAVNTSGGASGGLNIGSSSTANGGNLRLLNNSSRWGFENDGGTLKIFREDQLGAGKTTKASIAQDASMVVVGRVTSQAGLTVSGGTVDFSGQRVLNVGTPTTSSDAANLGYVTTAIDAAVPFSWNNGQDKIWLKDANDKLGLGTTSPDYKLDVSSATGMQLRELASGNGLRLKRDSAGGSQVWQLGIGAPGFGTTFKIADSVGDRLAITNTGNVGIGNVNPQARLHLTAVDSTTGNGAQLILTGPSSNPGNTDPNTHLLFRSYWHTNNSSAGFAAIGATDGGNADGKLWFATAPTGGTQLNIPQKRMWIDGSGNVGIGTESITAGSETFKLSVDGKVRAREVVVNNDAWADYVFADNYRNAPLSEVEQHIKEHKHLPGIPSAREVEEKGVNVGQMQALLLSKIEELTLHMIEQEKRLKRLEAENAALRTAANQ